MQHDLVFRLPLLIALGLPAAAQTRIQFSVDWVSPSVGLPACTGTPMTEGDILSPCGGALGFGALARPEIAIPGGLGGLGLPAHPGCVGHPAGTPCGVEVDAFTQGSDDRFQPNFPISPGDLWFSVDEFAAGIPGLPAPPNLMTEVPAGDASADALLNSTPLPPAPLPPIAGIGGHIGTIDGDGFVSGSGYVYPGWGLIEPNPPIGGAGVFGDNVDALNLEAPPGSGTRYYFSLDAGSTYVDPCSGNTGTSSAAAAGFSPSDVLFSSGSGPTLFAPAFALGLDYAGFGTDDLDALILAENGNGVFELSSGPYDWMGGTTDMLMFSVRRGSAVIGNPDSVFGLPIEAGDILIPPVVGGVSDYPGIWIAAEDLGLGTVRSGFTGPCGTADDLVAMDHHRPAVRDCDGNGVEDTIDILLGTYPDANLNGVPDPCDPPILIATPYCYCPLGPCGNNDPTAGCENSTGGGALLSATGSSSWILDDLVLTVSNMPTFQFGFLFMGTLPGGPTPLVDGLLCVGGNICRYPIQNSGPSGTFSQGTGIVATSATILCPILPGDVWHFQSWYRDPGSPCGFGSNLSNAMQVTFY